jgi:XTP/dITP diphosphohydrolase
VYSARYAGPLRNAADNVALLLQELQGQPNRRAQFRTVVALVLPDGRRPVFEGAVEGLIAEELHGAGGFGYDPVFRPEQHQRTFAEMPLAEKNTMSHRARAVEKLVTFLQQEL